MIGSFSTNPEVDEIILNKENLRPEYSQTEDATIDDDFRLQVATRNLKRNQKCQEVDRETRFGTAYKCKPGCICSDCKVCKVCEVCKKCAREPDQ